MSLLSITNLKVHFPVRGGVFMRAVASCKAVDGVSLTVAKGETVGLVGESGCGKTTLGKAIVRLLKPTDGSLTFDGQDIATAGAREMKALRRHLQIIFQDPFGSMSPRRTIGPGCRFRARCPVAGPDCAAPVAMREPAAGHAVRCVRVAA